MPGPGKRERTGGGSRQRGRSRNIGSRGLAVLPPSGESPILTSLWVGPGKCRLDDVSGTHTGTSEANIINPADIVSDLLTGFVASPSFERSSGWGDIEDARDALDNWATQKIGATDEWLMNLWSNETPLDQLLDVMAGHLPGTIFRDPTDGTFRMIVLPESGTPASAQQYKTAAGNAVKFHPNAQRGTLFGAPYQTLAFRAGSNRSHDLVTKFRVKFSKFMPTGSYVEEVSCDRTQQTIWSNASQQIVSAGSGTLVTACGDAYTNRNDLDSDVLDVALDFCYDPATATTVLYFLVQEFTKWRVWVEGQVGLEGLSLLPGYFFQISNDMNLYRQWPGYSGGNWESAWFYCDSVSRTMQESQIVTTFSGQEVLKL